MLLSYFMLSYIRFEIVSLFLFWPNDNIFVALYGFNRILSSFVFDIILYEGNMRTCLQLWANCFVRWMPVLNRNPRILEIPPPPPPPPPPTLVVGSVLTARPRPIRKKTDWHQLRGITHHIGYNSESILDYVLCGKRIMWSSIFYTLQKKYRVTEEWYRGWYSPVNIHFGTISACKNNRRRWQLE